MDKLSTHETLAVHARLLRQRRLYFRFSVTYGSWMSIVKRQFSALTTKKLQRSAYRSVK